MFESLDIVILNVSDLQASRKFYKDVMGLKVKNESENWVEFQLGETSLAIRPEPEGLEDPRKVKWGHALAFKVDDVDAVYEQLRQRGVHFLVKPRDEFFGRHAEFVDPDGHIYSITTPEKS